mmetsp:Transcript_18498/g.38130  ORF Transcript_18498/g.38130 Transcript_18498/m.38130 type:complete len:103 (-) Transcript_18498:256-564(-)
MFFLILNPPIEHRYLQRLLSAQIAFATHRESFEIWQYELKKNSISAKNVCFLRPKRGTKTKNDSTTPILKIKMVDSLLSAFDFRKETRHHANNSPEILAARV